MVHSREAFMRQVLRSSIAGVVVAGVLSAGATAGAQPRTRTVFVTAIDKQGSPVADLQAADFEVKVGGKVQDVVSVQPAAVPYRVALIDADGGTGAFQRGLALFMQRLLGKAEFALISVIVQPEVVVDYTPEAAPLSAGLSRLGPRGPQTGAQLIEAIQDATKSVRSETRRPVIVVTRVGGEGPSVTSGRDVREALRKSGAILYVISTAGAEAKSATQARSSGSAGQMQVVDPELADSASNLGQVLGDGSKESGGRHDQVIGSTLAQALEQVANELLHQYQIAYAVGDGVKPGEKLSVASSRKGVTVRAPARLPN
jgi:VWFA-related protein